MRELGWRHLVGLLGVAFVMFPIIWIISASFNEVDSLATSKLIPEGVTTDSYEELFQDETFPFGTWLANSIKVAFVAASIQLLLSTLAAFAFARMRFAGRRIGLLTILLVQMFPQFLAFVALFLLLDALGDFIGDGFRGPILLIGIAGSAVMLFVAARWFNRTDGRDRLWPVLLGVGGVALLLYSVINPGYSFPIIPQIGNDTHTGLILVYLGGSVGVNTWLIKGFMDSIPMSLDESAKVDGASDWQIFARVVTPLARPVLAVIFFITFVFIYNEFILAQTILSDVDNLTYATGLTLFVESEYSAKWGQIGAAAVIGALPIVIVYLLAQEQIVGGLTQGAVKE
jgi:ABC-type maltose transport system permease subunit